MEIHFQCFQCFQCSNSRYSSGSVVKTTNGGVHRAAYSMARTCGADGQRERQIHTLTAAVRRRGSFAAPWRAIGCRQIEGASYQMVKRDDTKLRDYQQDLIDETVEALRDHRSVLLQAPTGAGKTEMAVEIARKARDKVVWFVCHRQEIVAQTSAALKRAGVDSHGVVAPRYPEDPATKIQVCSIAALRHRFKRYPPPDLIILDECHHAPASSWAKLIERFPDAKLLGLTATPERLDGRGLEDWFEHMIVGPDTRTLIDEGYLSKFKYFAPTILDMRGVRVRGKEYDPRDLEKARTPSLAMSLITSRKSWRQKHGHLHSAYPLKPPVTWRRASIRQVFRGSASTGKPRKRNATRLLLTLPPAKSASSRIRKFSRKVSICRRSMLCCCCGRPNPLHSTAR
jgi:hypothetical protein